MLQLDNQLCFALYAANHAMHRLYRQRLQVLGLTYPQYLVMLVLWENDGLSVSAIGDRLFLDSATLTPLLKRLEQSGLLRRERSTRDERQVLVSLSEAGRALRQQARAVPEDVSRSAGCSPTQLRSLREQLQQLRQQLNAAS